MIDITKRHIALDHLAVFHAVAVEGSISRGAERLLVSQPAVSKQVRQLEKRVDTVLFDRVPRGVRLTEAGTLLADYARRIFTLEAEARQALAELKGLRRGRLTLGASTTIGIYLLPELFVRFRQRFPAVQLNLAVAASDAIEKRLSDGELDMGLTEAFSGAKDLDGTVFHEDELVAIAPRAHPLLTLERVTARRFCDEPFVVRETGSDTKSFAERALAERGLSPRPVMALGTTEAIKRAVAAGVGVAIVSRLSLGLELKAKTLVAVPLADLHVRRPLYCITRAGRNVPEALRAFLELLKAATAVPRQKIARRR